MMKKFAAFVMAATMAVSCAALASAETREVVPVNAVSMETYGSEDSTVMAQINPEDIDENNVMIYSVYGNDLYNTADIKALQPGDILNVNGDALTVKTVEETGNGFAVNGGFLPDEGDEGDGATLIYVDGDPDHLVSLQYDDDISFTIAGQAAYQLADQVTVKTYKMTEDLDFDGEYDEVTLPAAEVKDYMISLTEKEDFPIDFVPSNCKVRLENGKVAEIVVDWSPNV